MFAIVTKYIGSTNTKGSRLKASNGARSVTIPYPHEAREGISAHSKAVEALCFKFGWTGAFVAGDTGGTGYTFVNVGSGWRDLIIEADESAVDELTLCATNERDLYPGFCAIAREHPDNPAPWRSLAQSFARSYAAKFGDKGRPYSDLTLDSFAESLRSYYVAHVAECDA